MSSLSSKNFTSNTLLQVIFVVLVIIIGIVTLISSLSIHNKILNNPKNCMNKNLYNSNSLIMILSTLIISFSISYLIFIFILKCSCKNSSPINLYILFTLILILLGISIFINGIIIHQKANKCDIKGSSSAILSLGLFILISGIILFIYNLINIKKIEKIKKSILQLNE